MRLHLTIALLGLASALSASASSFSNLVVFGDSLSDTGNLYRQLLGLGPGPLENYATGIVTDGPNTTPSTHITGVWDQQLAQFLGLPSPVASTSGGSNYAYAGAETGTGLATLTLDGVPVQVPNLNTQIASFFSANGPVVSPNNLYALWGGSNDILNNAAAFTAAPTAANLLTLENTPSTLISNEFNGIQTLYLSGARDFLFFDVPNLGATPAALALPAVQQSALTALSAQTEQDFLAAVGLLRSLDPGITVIPVDAFAGDLAIEQSFNALGANNPFGLTNITDAAQGRTGINPDQYQYWDTLHPTTRGHQIIAELADQAILANTPEPGTYALAGGALLLLVLIRYKRTYMKT